jgi:hypothetical protein
MVGVNPNLKFAVFGDNLATITTAGYLNSVNLESNPIASTDVLQVLYSFNNVTKVGTYGVFTVSISNSGVITLVEFTGTSGIVLPTIANHIATYTNTTGGLGEDPATAISGGNIQAGLSGTAGTVASFPATASKGSLILAGVANTGNTNTTISNAAMGQASVISIPDPGASTANFIMSALAGGGNQVMATSGLQASQGAFISGNNAGQSQAGAFTAYTMTGASGYLQLFATNNSGNFTTQITNIAQGQSSVYSIPDAANANARFLVAATNTPFVSGNLIQASGTGGLSVDSGISGASLSGAVTQLGQLQQISVTLSAAQVIASFATPIVLIPAAAGKVAIVHSANVYTASTGHTPFATGVAPIIQYGLTANGAGTIAVGTGLVTGDITAAVSQVRTIGQAATAVYTGITNTAIAFSCTTAYTAGTGTTVTFTLVYELITATV